MSGHPSYGRLDGPVVMVGFGSIGRGTLPLILRHFDVEAADIVVVAPDTHHDGLLDQLGVRKITAPITASLSEDTKKVRSGSKPLNHTDE